MLYVVLRMSAQFLCSVCHVLMTVKSSMLTERMMMRFCMRQWKRHVSASDWTNLCLCSSLTTALMYVCPASGVPYRFLWSLLTAWGCLKVPSDPGCCLKYTAILPEWSNLSWRYAAFMSMCSMCMLKIAARANRSRTVVLSAMYGVVFSRSKCTPGIILSPLAEHRGFLSTIFPCALRLYRCPCSIWTRVLSTCGIITLRPGLGGEAEDTAREHAARRDARLQPFGRAREKGVAHWPVARSRPVVRERERSVMG